MRQIRVYPAMDSGWIYEVWIAARAIVIGHCATREAAEEQARLA